MPPHGRQRSAGADGPRGFGFIETAEDEVYVHRNSVIGEFDALNPGSGDFDHAHPADRRWKQSRGRERSGQCGIRAGMRFMRCSRRLPDDIGASCGGD